MRTFLCQLAVVALAAGLAACGGKADDEPTNEAENTQISADLEQEFGALTTEDETDAYFGEEEVFDEIELSGEDEAITDELETSTEVADIEKAADVGRYIVRVTWGNHGVKPDLPETVWDGSIEVDQGAIIGLRKLLWEATEKVLPRTSKGKIEFQSVTKDHIDGALLRGVYEIPLNAMMAPPKLTFTSKALESPIVIDLGQLPHKSVTKATEGTQVAIHVWPYDPAKCTWGFLAGRWHSHAQDLGRFRGRWVSPLGVVHGYLRGIWGKKKDGTKVFFGKYVDATGKFQGLLKGTYDSPGNQELTGEWFAKDKTKSQGKLAGSYIASPLGDKKGGWFLGGWKKEGCQE